MEHIGLSFPDDKIIYALPEEATEIPVGSLPDNTIYLPFRGVSRRHCTLIRREGRVWIRDEKSHNGTFLNDERIQESSLSDGDHIRAGIVSMTFFTEKTSREVSLRLPRLSFPPSSRWKSVDTKDLSEEKCDLEDEIYFFPHMIFPEGTVLGRSSSMFTPYHKISLSVDGMLPVLFLGEHGVGKRHFARALHLSGPLSDGPFITCDCGEANPECFEAELFGEKEGEGLFDQASGGTLFLGNVEVLPLFLQERILRILKEQDASNSFRLISSLGSAPDRLLSEHRLHRDLYSLMAGIHIPIPPLRHRKVDMKCLIRAFLDEECRKAEKEIPGATARLLDALTEFSFPDNLIGLKRLLREMVATVLPGEMLDLQHLPSRVSGEAIRTRIETVISGETRSDSINLPGLLDEISRDVVAHALAMHMGNLGQAAAYLGMSRKELSTLIARLEI